MAPQPGLGDPTTSSESASLPGAWTSMLEELLDSRINTLVSTVRVELEQLRSETSAAMDSLSDAVQQHEVKISEIEETIQGVNIMAQELSEKIMPGKGSDQEGSDPWSDWDLLDCLELIGLKKRVGDLEGGDDGTATGPPSHPLRKQVDDILERVADLEGERPDVYVGGVPKDPRRDSATSLMDS